MNLAYIPSPTFSKFEIGPFTIHMYAICILIGICVAVWILATRWKRYGGTFDQILDTTLVTVPCALVGARLYHCITTPADYFPPTGNLVNILKVWEGGMAIFGGISVGTLVAFLWCRHKHYPFAIFAVDSVHEGTITEIFDKGAVVALPYGVEGFATPRHLVKEDGSQAKVDEKLEFKVIEFNKAAKRIIVSHSRVFEDAQKSEEKAGTGL